MTPRLDDRFDEAVDSLTGFYRTWFISLGLELGFVRAIADAGPAGIAAPALARATGTHPPAVDTWCRGAYAHRLLEASGAPGEEHFSIEPELAQILLDEASIYYLGGQFQRSVTSTLDYGEMAEFMRAGRTLPERPPRYHRAIEKVTVQDIALFLEEGLPHIDELERRFRDGIRALDVGCGGGRWMLTLAGHFPASRFVGVEFEPDSVARAMRHVAEAGLGDRVRVEAMAPAEMPFRSEFDLGYFQDVLHELPDPVGALRAAWTALRRGGLLVVFDWCIPDRLEDYRTPLGELIWGVQIDELLQGTALLARGRYVELALAAGLPAPRQIEIEAGATLFVAGPVG